MTITFSIHAFFVTFMVGIVIYTRLLKALIKFEMQMGRHTLQLLLDKSN